MHTYIDNSYIYYIYVIYIIYIFYILLFSKGVYCSKDVYCGNSVVANIKHIHREMKTANNVGVH